MTKTNRKQVRTRMVINILDRKSGTQLVHMQNYDEVEQKTGLNKKGCMSRARDICLARGQGVCLARGQGFVRYMQQDAIGAPYERSILAVIMRTTFGAGSQI